MDVDLFNVEQIEVVKGPASCSTNGAIGGIVNVVDNTIARKDLSESESVLGMETVGHQRSGRVYASPEQVA